MKTVRIIKLAVFMVSIGVALYVAQAHQPAISRGDRSTAPTAASTLGAPVHQSIKPWQTCRSLTCRESA